MEKVQVLMSTYNGMEYIRDQIESILSQREIHISLLIRDDGSTDDTITILKDYEKYNNIKVVYGKNIGVTASFFELIRLANDYDYYAFSDQDDVWDENKIINAINLLNDYKKVPAVYSSNARLVDKNLKVIMYEDKRPKISLESAMMKNYCTGCTMVFNLSLMKYAKMYVPKNNYIMHDWWINVLSLSLGGRSVFDHKAYISYRQHGNNVVGSNYSVISKLNSRYKKFRKNRYHRDFFADELLNFYGENISQNERCILECFSFFKKRQLLSKRFCTGDIVDTFLFKVCVILNKI